MGEEINRMIERIIPQLQQVWTLLLWVSVLMGLAIILIGLYRMGGAGGRAGTQSQILPKVLVLVGIVILNIPAALDTITMSTLQEASTQSLSYIPPESAGRHYIQLAVYLIQIIGLCGFIRGWSLMGKIGSRGDGVFWKATSHIIGGAWAVNIIGFLHMLGFTFGGPVQDAVSLTIG